MCDACLMDQVKRHALTRRSLFVKAAATTAGAIAAGLSSARPALAQAKGKAVDLTHAYDGSFPTFDGKPGIFFDPAVKYADAKYQLWKLTIFEHTGTHIDAPLHFTEAGVSVDALPVESLVAPIMVIDIQAKARQDDNAMVETSDIEAFISKHGAIPPGAVVAMHSGWAAKVGTPAYRNRPDGKLAFPGFSKGATDLLEQLNVGAIAVDTLSLDPGNSPDFAVHFSWLPGGRFGIENVANLDRLPAKGATVFVGAPKHKGGTGGPARLLAVV